MKTKKIAGTIITMLCMIMLVVVVAACDQDRGMMHGNISVGRDHWNWGQILISLAIGLVGGFILGQVTARRK